MEIFTIGYGDRSKEEFLHILQNNGVAALVDVRLRPDKAYNGAWAKAKSSDKGIEKWLFESGISYYALIELGNIFMECPDWPDRYTKLLESAGELLTARLESIARPWCLFCAEKYSSRCHRRILAEYLAAKNPDAQILHL